MLTIFIGLLTVLLVLDCVFLVLLVLLQLPKKEAGVGTAFGGGATDVLFGAGTGNVLTKATGYAAAVFLGLCLILAIMQNHSARNPGGSLRKKLAAPGPAPAAPAMPADALTTTGAAPLQVPVVPAATPPPAKTETAPPTPAPSETAPAAPKTEPPAAAPAPAQKEPKN